MPQFLNRPDGRTKNEIDLPRILDLTRISLSIPDIPLAKLSRLGLRCVNVRLG